MKIDLEIAQKCRAWPFEEAKTIIKRLRALNRGEIKATDKGYVLFQTGYGASGLPHIGTFGEVARTTMVMHAFKALCPNIPTKLLSFADDMDGLRKVPTNVPNQDMLKEYLDQPLTAVPDPFGTHKSFGDHNNARMREFLDGFGFDYEFMSSTEAYKSGRFDKTLLAMLQNYDAIVNAVTPILGEERAKTYSPFMPISPTTGKVLQVPILETNPDAGTIIFKDEDGKKVEQEITGGKVKAQWRADWALRWYALDVDYEMAGEDLISAANIAGDIVQVLGGRKPAGFRYKLFLDEDNQKISKSKGNGLTMEEWLKYAPHESLSYYMFQRPTSGKKLYFDIIPKAVDEYITFINKMPEQTIEKKLENPAWYIHSGRIPNSQHTPVSFALLLNLASAANAHDKEKLWSFILRYKPDANPQNAPFLDRLVGYAIKYYEDFVLPTKQYRKPDERERTALEDLYTRLEKIDSNLSAEEYMTEVFSAGKANGYDKSELREWFQAIYQVLLGQDQGPRFGSFIELYGVDDTKKLIRDALNDKLTTS
ncbi:MAG: lysine--tRNA ligase [Alphaproteobacteria bacterium]|nr:lysine--tRNA ligase [Alphaproteobacteria bacterium]